MGKLELPEELVLIILMASFRSQLLRSFSDLNCDSFVAFPMASPPDKADLSLRDKFLKDVGWEMELPVCGLVGLTIRDAEGFHIVFELELGPDCLLRGEGRNGFHGVEECSKYYSDINKWGVKELFRALKAGEVGKESGKGMGSLDERKERWGKSC